MLVRIWKKENPRTLLMGKLSWYSYYGNQYEGFSEKLKIELPYDPAVPRLGIYLEKTRILIGKGTCTPVFIATQTTVAKTQKLTKCPSTDELIKKTWYGLLLSHLQ